MKIIFAVHYAGLDKIGIYKWHSGWPAWKFACSLVLCGVTVAVAPYDFDKCIEYRQFPSGKVS